MNLSVEGKPKRSRGPAYCNGMEVEDGLSVKKRMYARTFASYYDPVIGLDRANRSHLRSEELCHCCGTERCRPTRVYRSVTRHRLQRNEERGAGDEMRDCRPGAPYWLILGRSPLPHVHMAYHYNELYTCWTHSGQPPTMTHDPP
jgi:hypothetical protein